jgi:hypothetical protein
MVLLLLVSIHFSGSVVTGNVLHRKLKLQTPVILKLAQLVSEELPSYSTNVLVVNFLLSCGAINISSGLIGGLLACLATKVHNAQNRWDGIMLLIQSCYGHHLL